MLFLDTFKALAYESLLQNTAPSNPYLKAWEDIEEFSASSYGYAPYSGTSKLSSKEFEIKLLEKNTSFLRLSFHRTDYINGGARIREWGNDGSCDTSDSTSIANKPPSLLYLLGPTEAQVLFPDFPQCVVWAKRNEGKLTF